MSRVNDPEDWRMSYCPVHHSPLDFNGRCPLCDSLEKSYLAARETVATISRDSVADFDDEEEDYDYGPR